MGHAECEQRCKDQNKDCCWYVRAEYDDKTCSPNMGGTNIMSCALGGKSTVAICSAYVQEPAILGHTESCDSAEIEQNDQFQCGDAIQYLLKNPSRVTSSAFSSWQGRIDNEVA